MLYGGDKADVAGGGQAVYDDGNGEGVREVATSMSRRLITLTVIDHSTSIDSQAVRGNQRS